MVGCRPAEACQAVRQALLRGQSLSCWPSACLPVGQMCSPGMQNDGPMLSLLPAGATRFLSADVSCAPSDSPFSWHIVVHKAHLILQQAPVHRAALYCLSSASCAGDSLAAQGHLHQSSSSRKGGRCMSLERYAVQVGFPTTAQSAGFSLPKRSSANSHMTFLQTTGVAPHQLLTLRSTASRQEELCKADHLLLGPALPKSKGPPAPA